MDQSKTCSKCGETKPLDSFQKHASCKFGRRPDCKACVTAYKRAYSEAHKVDIAAKASVYRLANVEKIATRKKAWAVANATTVAAKKRLYLEAHSASARAAYSKEYRRVNEAELRVKSREYALNNKAKLADASSSYYLANKEDIAVKAQLYRKANPEKRAIAAQKRRAHKAGNAFFVVTAKELKRIRSSPCVHCGATEDIHVDHVIPLSKGGAYSIGNLQPLCAGCNMAKHDSFYMVFKVRVGGR